MTVVLIGASYKEISLSDLEMLESKSIAIKASLFSDHSADHGIEGCVVVSTCNRFEVYIDTETALIAEDFVTEKISQIAGIPSSKMSVRTGHDAIEHLFRVCSGLESMIVGEVEIAGQVKRSLAQSQILNHTSRITEALFQRASEVSKRISNETGIGTAGRSLITGGLDIVKEHAFTLKNKKVLIIGTGAYARVVTTALNREQVSTIFTYSNSGRAEIFAEIHGTTAVESSGLANILKEIDLIVACSGSRGIIITEDDLKSNSKVLLPVIDLTLARDVEKSIEKMPNVMVIDLEAIHRGASPEHHETILKAQSLIKEEVTEFLNDLKARRNDPLIRALREHIDQMVLEEVERVRRKGGDEVANQVARSLRSVTKTIFHKPTISARGAALNDGIDEYRKAIEVLFGLNVSE